MKNKLLRQNEVSRRSVSYRLLALFLLLFTTSLCFTVSSQEAKITLKIKDRPLSEVLNQIEAKSGYSILVRSNDVNLNEIVSVDATNLSVSEVLNELFKQSKISYEISGKNISVFKPQTTTQSTSTTKITPRRITGIVTDAKTGESIIGATVQVRGTGVGTVTDFDGRYSIEVRDANPVLVFSYVGYMSETVQIAKQTVVDVKLSQDVKTLEEVVVVGYGTMKKRDITGSIASVKTQDLQAVPVFNVGQALKARVAGVNITTNSGDPGARLEVRIRGGNSMMANNEPLYVVDGFPMVGGIEFLNPADVESMDVLKDASATAIYGSRGANGVVIITTKSGRKDVKGQIEVSSQFSVQQAEKLYDMLDARQYAVVSNEWIKNSGGTPVLDPEIMTGPGTDWQSYIFRTARMQDHTITFMGGTDKNRYSLSGNYFDQEGIIINTGAKRGSIRFNIDHEVKNWLRLGFNANLGRRQRNIQDVDNGTLGNNIFSGALSAPPTLPVYDEDGKPTVVANYYLFTSPDIKNPMVFAAKKNLTVRNSVLGNTFLEFKITENLTFKTLLGLEFETYLNETYTPIIYKGDKGAASERSYIRNSFLNENTLNYSKEFDDIHSVKLLAGFTYQNNEERSHSISVSDFISNITQNYSLQSATTVNPPSSSWVDWKLASYLGRVNYTLKDRYLFTASMRVDGSSKFGANNRWGYFPSGAFAWRATQEDFMKGVEQVKDLKIRVSYGVTGNQGLNPYQTIPMMGSNRYIFSNHEFSVGFSETNIANKDLKWESTGQFNVGLDLNLFDDLFIFTFDYYRKHTYDLLASEPIPWSTGFRTILKNIGEIENKGMEFSLQSYLVSTKNFKWDVSGNISMNRNKVLKLAGNSDIFSGGVMFTNTNLARVGEPLGVFFGYIEDGLDSNGQIRYKDLTEDGAITTADRTILGSPYADFTYGFNTNLMYRNLSLNIFVEGSQGNELFWETAGSNLNSFQKGTNQLADLYGNYWTAENPDPNAKYPKIGSTTIYSTSDRFVLDASYVRLKSVTLSYNLPTKKAGMEWLESAQLYVSGSNLLTLTKYPGLSPDVNTRGNDNFDISSRLTMGIDASSYPSARILSVGLRLKL